MAPRRGGEPCVAAKPATTSWASAPLASGRRPALRRRLPESSSCSCVMAVPSSEAACVGGVSVAGAVGQTHAVDAQHGGRSCQRRQRRARPPKPTRGEAARASKPSVAPGSMCCGRAVLGVDMTHKFLAPVRRHSKQSCVTRGLTPARLARQGKTTSGRQARVVPGESPRTSRVHMAIGAAAPSHPRRGR